MSVALRLTHDEPKLVYLALVHHLGRPGSELDPETLQPVEHGLRAVKTQLGNELNGDSAVVELDDTQYRKLLSAIYGSVNELRVHHMRGGSPSTVDRFTETALTLFPEIARDPDDALAVAESMMMLHRRMERAVRGAAPPEAANAREDGAAVKGKRRWPFGR